MTTTEWIWLILGIVVVFLILGGISYLAQERRQIKAQRRPEYQPPSPKTGSIIFGGDVGDTASASSKPSRIQWGDEQELNWEWTRGRPCVTSADDGRVKCPICRLELNEMIEQIMVCPHCNTRYHRHCLAEMAYTCSICERQVS